MKKPSVFAHRPGSYAVRSDDGRAATVVATCLMDALKKAMKLWPEARELRGEFLFA